MHSTVTRDLERMLVDNHPCVVMWIMQCNLKEHNVAINTYTLGSSRSSISYVPPKHLSNHHAHKPQKLEMALEITLPHLI